LLSQFIGTVVALAWAFAWGCGVFYVIRYHMGLRVSDLMEAEGLDKHIHGTPCYPVEEGFEGYITAVPAEEEAEIREAEKAQVSLLEQAMSKDAGRERIYSDKLGRWVYAMVGTEKPKKGKK
jgi:Amt family ammonium transporter